MNNKTYVGITKNSFQNRYTKTPHKWVKYASTILKRAIEKYGFHSFDVFILRFNVLELC